LINDANSSAFTLASLNQYAELEPILVILLEIYILHQGVTQIISF